MAPFKDEINADVVDGLAAAFADREPAFDADRFRRTVLADLDRLELKDRINLVADALADRLPSDYPAALAAVVDVARTDVGPWASWPLCSFVERHGLDHPEPSLEAMAELTIWWSCEFAVRPFLDRHLTATRAHMARWVTDPDERVRRLASEGSRPLLPWGMRVRALLDDPEIGLQAVRALRHDPSETVRRSVANHLNDVAKHQPDRVVEELRQWIAEPAPTDERMVAHALRTLVKQGRSDALELLGFTTEPEVDVRAFGCSPDRVELGGEIELTATLVSTADVDQRLVIDFVVHHRLASGASSPKVFKWTNRSLPAGATMTLTKTRRLKPITTRTYHPGTHQVDLQVAGVVVASTAFQLDL